MAKRYVRRRRKKKKGKKGIAPRASRSASEGARRYDPMSVGTDRIDRLVPKLPKVRKPSDPDELERQEFLENEYFEEGVMLYKKKIYDEAVKKYEAVVALSPNDADCQFNIALCYRNMNKIKKAQDAVLCAVKIRNNWSTAWKLAANLFYKQKMYVEAEQACCRAIATNQAKEYKVYELLGKALWDQERKTTAAEIFQECLVVYDRSSMANYYLGMYYFGKKNLHKASTYLERAVSISPRFTQAFYLLGRTFCMMGLISSAKDNFESVTNLDPNRNDAVIWLKFIDLVTGTLKKFVPNAHPGYKTPESLADAYFHLGLKLIDEKQLQDATDILQKASVQYEDSYKIHVWLGICYALNFRYDRALERWKSLADQGKKDQALLILLSIGYIIIAEPKKALTIIETLPEKIGGNLRKLAQAIPGASVRSAKESDTLEPEPESKEDPEDEESEIDLDELSDEEEHFQSAERDSVGSESSSGDIDVDEDDYEADEDDGDEFEDENDDYEDDDDFEDDEDDYDDEIEEDDDEYEDDDIDEFDEYEDEDWEEEDEERK